MLRDMKIPSPTSTASWSPSPCLTSESSDCATDVPPGSRFPNNLTFVLYGRIGSCVMATSLSADVAGRLDDLVARACDRAGLDNFGGESWREGLDLLVETCESAPGVNPGGRELVYGEFVDALW